MGAFVTRLVIERTSRLDEPFEGQNVDFAVHALVTTVDRYLQALDDQYTSRKLRWPRPRGMRSVHRVSRNSLLPIEIVNSLDRKVKIRNARET